MPKTSGIMGGGFGGKYLANLVELANLALWLRLEKIESIQIAHEVHLHIFIKGGQAWPE